MRCDWQDIVRMFTEDLRLPAVTDDRAAVEEAIEARTPRQRRNANSPDLIERQRAAEWLRRMAWLKQDLGSAVATVEKAFRQTAQATIEVADADDTSVRSGADFRERLVAIACDQYHADESLAQRWVDGLWEEAP
jgi:hypothetical protein